MNGRTGMGLSCTLSSPVNLPRSAYIERFNGKFRDECLNPNYFLSLNDARAKIEAWRIGYNTERPHSSLGYLPPEKFVESIQNSQSSSAAAVLLASRPNHGRRAADRHGLEPGAHNAFRPAFKSDGGRGRKLLSG
jgi:hypothetical protein